MGEIWKSLIACGGFIATAVITVGALFGVARFFEWMTRGRKRPVVPIDVIFGEVIELPPEAKTTSGNKFAGGKGLKATRRCTHTQHTSPYRTSDEQAFNR